MLRGVSIAIALLAAQAAAAQSFGASAHMASSQWSEFNGSDLGVGGRIAWQPSPLIGIEAGVTWYPSDFPDGIVFTRYRVESLFGATVGPRLNRIRPFAKVASGFLKVGATSGPFVCIAIFPPPLNCALAGGDTVPVFEIGGGVEVDATARTFLRVDIADRILKYPGPTLGPNFEIREEGFFGHALRFTFGGGFRF